MVYNIAPNMVQKILYVSSLALCGSKKTPRNNRPEAHFSYTKYQILIAPALMQNHHFPGLHFLPVRRQA